MALRLVIEDDEGKTTVVPLIRDEITIGRQEGNTIRLTERNVSRRHARLMTARDTGGGTTVLVEDLDSYNGVRLNGQRIHQREAVGTQDLIQIGDYSLALRVDQPAVADTEAQIDAVADGIDHAPTEVHHVETDVLPDAEQARIVAVSSNLAGETWRLDRREVICGRTADENDVVINHRSISRNHAKIICRDGQFTIIDLASSNGVKVNGVSFGTAGLVNGDIVELGHVKLRFVAPGDDYVFTRADIDDVDLGPRRGTGRMVLLALVLVAVGVGAFLLVRSTTEPTPEDAPAKAGVGPEVESPAPPKDTPPAIDIESLLAEGRGFLDNEQWQEAGKVFERVLQHDPDHAEAKEKRKQAQKEAENEKRFQRVLKDVDDRQWSDAFFALEDFPADSVYHDRLEQKRERIEAGFADSELERGKKLIEQSDLDGARKVQVALDQKPFAKAQASALAAAIAEAEKPEPDAAVAAPPEVAERPQRKPPRERRARPRRPAPVAAPAGDYDALLEEALKELAAGQRAKAIKLLHQARKLKPGAHTPHQRLCAIYKAMRRYESALNHCRIWLRMEPNNQYKPGIERSIQIMEQELNRR